jgi:two-component system chemotaxis sensor kinase CheA
MSEAQIQRFIFAPGFTTSENVTSLSGRGVGLDVVRANIDEIGGIIDVKSVPGQSTAFSIKIPLTLAIVSALIVEAGGDRFAIPQLAVIELVRVRSDSEHRIEHIKDAAVLRLRNKLLPLVHLKTLLKIDGGADGGSDSGFIVVTSVIMIIEPNGIARSIGSVAVDRDMVAAEQEVDLQDEDSGIESMLVFRAGSLQPQAVPLSLVTRLEEIDVGKIETANGRSLVQYRGQLMPLIPVNDEVRFKQAGKQPLLVFADEGRSMALVVDEIVDIVEQRLDIELVSQQLGVLGSAQIRGQATEVIDVGYYLPLAFEDWQIRRDRRAAASRTDIEMPGMDGFELTSAVRQDPRTASLPVIGLSSEVSVSAVERGRQVGLHDYVAKFDRQGLVAALKEQTSDMSRAA